MADISKHVYGLLNEICDALELGPMVSRVVITASVDEAPTIEITEVIHDRPSALVDDVIAKYHLKRIDHDHDTT